MADNGTRVTRRKLSDYKPDPHNANRGTERGVYMLDRSIEEVGLARSIVAAADGTIPAGNKTLQAAADAGIEDVIEVETDGRALVVVKRTDWATVDAEQARRYAYYDNRASDVDLDFNAAQIMADLEAGIDLSAMFFDDELDELRRVAAIEEDDLPDVPSISRMSGPRQVVKVALFVPDLAIVEQALAATGQRNRGEALVQICQAFLDAT
jgi:lysozyme family protein